MSIINDMLLDLDARAQVGVAEEARGCLPDRAVTPRAGLYLGCLAVVGVVAAVGFYAYFPARPKMADPHLPSAIAPFVLPNESAAAGPQPTTAPVARPIVASAISAADGVAASVNEDTASTKITSSEPTVRALLANAEAAFQRNRLTLPERGSALFYFREVLGRDPNNAAAREGLARIERKYRELLGEAVSAADRSQLVFLLDRAKIIGLNLDFTAYREALVEREAQPSDPQIAIEQTPLSRDKAIVREADSLYAGGDKIAARQLLAAFVENYPLAEHARQALFGLYLRDAAFSQAEALLSAWQTEPVAGQMMAARLQVAEGRQLAALDLLAAYSVSELNQLLATGVIEKTLFEQYSALQAALLRATGNNLAAAEKYQMLIGVDPQNSQYWLGFGLASDSLGHYQNARIAYRRVTESRAVARDILTYTQQRLALLQAEVAGSQELADGGRITMGDGRSK